MNFQKQVKRLKLEGACGSCRDKTVFRDKHGQNNLDKL